MSNPDFALPHPDIDETGPYALVGQARARPGSAEELEQALVALVAPTREETGALQYHVHRDRADPDLFVFYEAWASLADLKEHLQMPYIQQFLAGHQELIDGEMQVTWLKMASPYPGA
ncbi:antibiotic biosynthesis monooxygenase [Labrenzia sp. R4_2]|uniref:putative quinol monooxygenase n=1 Tax=Labrenzia sp. R4_2 TaxID=2821107 RepID=UPI001AD96CD1|nr:putative quinol monooxygenase [Labrenzia sp. R4_2]MBO9418055.1 antibiotic biosynthesis monooxygenase [Labrenzia sp. R4_2]